jgi:hypothetical protein
VLEFKRELAGKPSLASEELSWYHRERAREEGVGTIRTSEKKMKEWGIFYVW